MNNYQQIVLASRPQGVVSPANFRLETVAVPVLKDGEVLVRNHYLSLDPYMRMRMEDVKSYAAPQALDEVMVGGTAGEVVASKNPKFAVGDKVVGMLGWSEMGVSDGVLLKKVDTTHNIRLFRHGRHARHDSLVWPDADYQAQSRRHDCRVRCQRRRGYGGGSIGQTAWLPCHWYRRRQRKMR